MKRASGWGARAVEEKIDALSHAVDERFTTVDQKIDTLAHAVDERLDAVDQRFAALDSSIGERFAAMDVAFVEQRQYTELASERVTAAMRAGFTAADGRMNGIDRKLDRVLAALPKRGAPRRRRRS